MSKYTGNLAERFSNKHYVKDSFSEEGLSAIDACRKKFSFSQSVLWTPYFPRNKQRYQIVKDHLSNFLGEKILDVGTRDNTLSEMIERPVALVDKNNPDLPEFNWEKENLPFKDNSFDTLVCLDVLEHIENSHEALADLVRVSGRHVVISLPNCWRKAVGEFAKGRGRWATYGFPPEKPMDRHKWFFNVEDAEDLIFYNAPKYGYSVEKVIYHIPKTILRLKIMYPLLQLILPEYQFKNLFTETVFFVLTKN
tara:strand:- start:20544 stop:21299 length:756 start_codon:yes stop_codon:yes gene_type:complete